jgi:xanthine dehydrogenase small subunit
MVSLAGYALNHHNPSPEGAIDAVNGNICRCTGYKSIERASATLAFLLQKRKSETLIQFAVDQQILPTYFLTIQDRLKQLLPTQIALEKKEGQIISVLGGGTDLYVQKHDDMLDADIDFLLDKTHLHGIEQLGENCIMGAAVTVTDMLESAVFNQYFPKLKAHIKLVSSTPIRNMATIAGNFINGSPIGDFTIFFLALDAQLVLTNGQHSRILPLRELYKGYKTLNKSADEIVEQVIFRLPDEHTQFNFEKVSKRIHLDIASVNTAIQIKVENGVILSAGITAGGVGPIPLYLQQSSAFILNKPISPSLVDDLVELVQQEIQPISDTRGTSTYKRLLLAQLIKAHFFQLYPEAFL